MTDVLDPEAILRCIDCGCEYDRDAPAMAPESSCSAPGCPCHSVWHMITPEAEKRALWGDR
jgi:hypothetical protein